VVQKVHSPNANTDKLRKLAG